MRLYFGKSGQNHRTAYTKTATADANAFAAAQTALEEANAALESAAAVVAKGSVGFFESRNAQAAIDALTKCTYASYIDLGKSGMLLISTI